MHFSPIYSSILKEELLLTDMQWGIPTLIASVAAHKYYPLYRNLTFQFKVYIQMSGMTVGSVIEADQRFRAYEKHTRRMRRVKRDQEAWKRYQDDYQEDLERSQKTTD